MSIKLYKRSMDGIIQFLLANHIRPIILEIPDYNIQKTFDRQKMSRKLLRRLSMFINNTLIDCKQTFRNALEELIYEKGYQNKVYVIRYNSWNNDYYNDLNQLYLDDGLHLNEHGYAKIDSVITKIITSK
jgi:lysophospholipase L1-like esterase